MNTNTSITKAQASRIAKLSPAKREAFLKSLDALLTYTEKLDLRAVAEMNAREGDNVSYSPR